MTPTLAVGCLAGAALWSVVRLAWSRDGLTEHLTALYRPPATRHTHHRRLLARLAERFGVTIGTSLTDDLIVVGRTPDAHLTARVTHLSAAVGVTVTAVAIAVGGFLSMKEEGASFDQARDQLRAAAQGSPAPPQAPPPAAPPPVSQPPAAQPTQPPGGPPAPPPPPS